LVSRNREDAIAFFCHGAEIFQQTLSRGNISQARQIADPVWAGR
jgi:hypothetical protein